MILYLLHYVTPGRHHGHYLGMAESERAIDLATVPIGPGRRPLPPTVAISDVWEVDDLRAASELYNRLARQGGRRRICSICSPGNSRGSGTGNWLRSARGPRTGDPGGSGHEVD